MTADYNKYDIAICGAGPVGLTLALLLTKHGMAAGRIALVDGKTVEQAAKDPRSIALSYGSRQILEAVGAWSLLTAAAAAATAIEEIHVSRRGHFGRTLIDRREFDLPALGYVTRYGALVNALAARAAGEGIAVLRPLQVNALDESETGVTLTCADGTVVHATLAAQAEGGIYPEQAGKSVQRDYDQTAVVAQVWADKAIAHRAYERFTEQGPLALLPQDDGYALVWCVRPARAAELLALADDAFLEALGAAFGTRLGRFTRITPRAAFPLGLNTEASNTESVKCSVAIGNAAQTLHPVAGQGLNLGLRDAMVLARLLAEDNSPAALQRFVAGRRTDRSLTIRLTDVMARVFAAAPEGALSQTLLGASLGLIDVLRPAKKMLAEHMMFGQRS
ncbi:MAG: FAD-dependent monooxygenase [Burkholderiaceae bacterium]|nr:FAD-dependent monooxygenase [Burkholderiaceae bacterium]